MKPSRDIGGLIEIMAALRDPESGCPWDVEQTFTSIAPYTIEEAYEVAEAIARGDLTDLRDELGDLLLQVVYHARMAEEADAFDFADVVEAIAAKMVRRHPHVFGDADARAAGQAKGMWDAIKAEEKRQRAERRGAGGENEQTGVLSEVPRGLPPLQRSVRLQTKAAGVGFDWDDVGAVLSKLREELDEVEHELDAGAGVDRLTDEVGDVFFAVANLSRHLGIDSEQALAGANAKFERRFAAIEAGLAKDGRTPSTATLEEMEAYWQAAKAAEVD
ncbi:nucleoside triphosphate pyrophosphohydrolase [Bauldia sp.]|uniref:nucleoside triphosphate pyrophosphohydrolase n=1 Tax=Bauldia sp. TaxID=2575872 RepID=UPI003BAC5CD3